MSSDGSGSDDGGSGGGGGGGGEGARNATHEGRAHDALRARCGSVAAEAARGRESAEVTARARTATRQPASTAGAKLRARGIEAVMSNRKETRLGSARGSAQRRAMRTGLRLAP